MLNLQIIIGNAVPFSSPSKPPLKSTILIGNDAVVAAVLILIDTLDIPKVALEVPCTNATFAPMSSSFTVHSA